MAYGGVFPSVDQNGRKLSGPRASLAGAKIAGGPYAVVQIRRGFPKKTFSRHIKGLTYYIAVLLAN